MSWLHAVEDDRAVLAIFGPEAPPLTSIDVTSIVLSYNGPTVVMSFALRDNPARPPAKWEARGFDTARLTLSFVDVRNVRLTGWDTTVIGDLSLERVANRVAVAFRSPTTTLTLDALVVDVQKISGSQRAPDDAPW